MLILNYLPNLPYHSIGRKYNFSSSLTVDVEDEFTFAIMSNGYLKFQRPDGSSYYSRYIVLNKRKDGYYKGEDKCLGDFIPTEYEGIYVICSYRVQENSQTRRINNFDLEIDETFSFNTLIKAKTINTTNIRLEYNIMRMIEIINILRINHQNPIKLYDFKEKILYKMLDIVLDGSRSAKKKQSQIIANNNKFTINDFMECYDYYSYISFLDKFIFFE
jgi:hypothetical protein